MLRIVLTRFVIWKLWCNEKALNLGLKCKKIPASPAIAILLFKNFRSETVSWAETDWKTFKTCQKRRLVDGGQKLHIWPRIWLFWYNTWRAHDEVRTAVPVNIYNQAWMAERNQHVTLSKCNVSEIDQKVYSGTEVEHRNGVFQPFLLIGTFNYFRAGCWLDGFAKSLTTY